MKLEPGPVAILEAPDFSPDVDRHPFLELAIEQERELGVADDEVGYHVSRAAEVQLARPGEDTDAPLYDASVGLIETEARPDLVGWEDVMNAIPEADDQVVRATNEAPPEAWAPVPDPIQRPPDDPGFEVPPEERPIDAPQV